MLKLNTEKKLELKKIVIIAIALVICWMVFYVVSDLVDIPISINRLIIIALVILPMVIVYWESRKITRAHSINKEEIDLLYSELDAKKEELKIQSEELFQSQRSIEENDFRYKTLFDLTSEGLFGMDADYNIIYYSTGWYESIGVDIINPDFNQWLTFFLDEYKSKFITNIDNQFHSEEKDFASEYRIKDIHGDIHWIRAIGKSIFDENGKFSSMTGVHRDITESKLHEEAIIKTAYYDRLTGLPNRLKFEDMVNEAIGKLAYFGVLYIDIDSFKAINDTYSHAFGDQVIIAMSNRLKKIVAPDDSISRLSGDEFVIISKNHKTKEELKDYTKYILERLSVPYTIGNISLSFTASIGVTMYPGDGENFNDLLVNLDIALSEAKDINKNSYKFFREEMRVKVLEQVVLENHLLKSLELKEMYVRYQPVMTLATKEIKGFEALLRWNDLEFGHIFPDVFIPIAEKTGYIHELGDFVLEEAIIFSKKLYDKYNKFFTMNVNVSAVQLRNNEFVDRVQELLVKYQFPAEYLNLEITESVALDRDDKVISRLAEIRKKGIDISLDDFGTGYSSLNNLVNLSVTHIKIDKSLVEQATTLKEVQKLIRGVVEFAHALELKVVAEGVETVNMESIISNMQIDYTQGYYYAKPLVEEDVFDFIKSTIL